MSRDSEFNREMKPARRIMKRRRKALATLASATPDRKFATTMKHADEVFRRFAKAYKDLAKR